MGREKGSKGCTEEPQQLSEMPWEDEAHPHPAATQVWILPGASPQESPMPEVLGQRSLMVPHCGAHAHMC